MSTKVSTSIANPTRTVGQGGAGLLIVQVIEAFNWYHFNPTQTGLAVIVFGGAVSFLQNTAENAGWIRPILRTIPPKKVDLVDELAPDVVDGPVEQTDNRPREGVDPDEQVSQDPTVAYGEEDLS